MKRAFVLALLVLLSFVFAKYLPTHDVTSPDAAWSNCYRACQTELGACDLACRGGDPGNFHYDDSTCSPKCSTQFTACQNNCNEYYAIPADQRPSIADWTSNVTVNATANATANATKNATWNANDYDRLKALGFSDADIDAFKKAGVDPNDILNETDENGEGCSRYCSGNILMENGRKGPDGNCWYNPYRCGSSCVITATERWAHCESTGQEKIDDAKKGVLDKMQELSSMCQKYAIPAWACNGVMNFDYSKAVVTLPADMEKLDALDQQFGVMLDEAYAQRHSTQQEDERAQAMRNVDDAKRKAYQDIIDNRINSDIDSMYDPYSLLTGLSADKLFRDNPDLSEPNAFNFLNAIGEITGEAARQQVVAGPAFSQAQEMMKDDFKYYVEMRQQYKKDQQPSFQGSDAEADRLDATSDAHAYAMARLKEKIDSDPGLRTYSALGSTIYSTDDYDKRFDGTYSGVRGGLTRAANDEFYDTYATEQSDITVSGFYSTVFDAKKKAKLYIIDQFQSTDGGNQ